LNKPYPTNLHTVRSCESCNNSTSRDEEYLSFLLRYIALIEDEKDIDDWLNKERRLRNEDALFDCLRVDESREVFINVDAEKVNHVLRKYAIGHAAFELGERMHEEPTYTTFAFKGQVGESIIKKINHISKCDIYPEVASRLHQRIVEDGENSWLSIQDGKYRYVVEYSPHVRVRIVIGEILLGEIGWDN